MRTLLSSRQDPPSQDFIQDLLTVASKGSHHKIVLFLLDQYPLGEQPDLSNVITLVSSKDRIQVTTCGAYIQSTWPTIGPRLLQAITNIILDETPQIGK